MAKTKAKAGAIRTKAVITLTDAPNGQVNIKCDLLPTMPNPLNKANDGKDIASSHYLAMVAMEAITKAAEESH